MDSQTLVGDQIEAGARVVSRVAQAVPLSIAFWVKPADGRRWTLFLVTPDADSLDGRRRVRQAVAAAEAGESVWGPLGLRYQLISPNSAVMQDVTGLHEEFYHYLPFNYKGAMLGDVPIEEAYFYPLLAATPAAA